MNSRIAILVVLAFSTACGSVIESSQKPATQPATAPNTPMKIKLKLPDKTLTATLHDNATARQFASMLPLTLTLQDYNKTEKISDLPRKLTTDGAPAGSDPATGDIAYYAPWGNLALFYKDFDYSKGLIILGRIDGEAEALNAPGEMKVTIELADARS